MGEKATEFLFGKDERFERAFEDMDPNNNGKLSVDEMYWFTRRVFGEVRNPTLRGFESIFGKDKSKNETKAANETKGSS